MTKVDGEDHDHATEEEHLDAAFEVRREAVARAQEPEHEKHEAGGGEHRPGRQANQVQRRRDAEDREGDPRRVRRGLSEGEAHDDEYQSDRDAHRTKLEDAVKRREQRAQRQNGGESARDAQQHCEHARH